MAGTSPILVQKFGGSSVATMADLRRVAGIIRQAHESSPVVAVVSARGKTTDQLLALANEFDSVAPPRELDQLLATGELASAALLAIALKEQGVPAVSLDGRQAGISALGSHGSGVVVSIDTLRICHLLAEGNVVVVAGFQGGNEAGDIVTLGRGGSDTTAVALSAALGQDYCQIYTDVNGIYTSDPRFTPSARELAKVHLTEIAEMAFAGAKVVHSRAAGLAVANGIELQVRSSFSTYSGTVIDHRPIDIEPESRVTAVAEDGNVVEVSLHNAATRLIGDVLADLAEKSMPIDLFNWRHDSVSFTVRQEDLPSVRAVLGAVVTESADIRITEDLAKASVIGRGLLSSAQFVARTVRTLESLNIPVITLSTSQLRISAVVPAGQSHTALEALHEEFELGRAIESSLAGSPADQRS